MTSTMFPNMHPRGVTFQINIINLKLRTTQIKQSLKCDSNTASEISIFCWVKTDMTAYILKGLVSLRSVLSIPIISLSY